MTGQLGNRTPRAVYYFDGLRGEVVTVRLRVIGGDLDPVLTVFDSDGNVLGNSDDSGGEFDAIISTQRIPHSGRYYIVAGRFGYGLGSTGGEYALTLERIGISSTPGSVLRYGDSVVYNITNGEPLVYYSFRAIRGDIVDVELKRHSGDLDPYLQVLQMVDGNFFVIAYNDDVLGAESPDAMIANLLIEETGIYMIEASRYGQAAGDTSGSFVLTLEEADNSGVGNSVQAPARILLGDVVEGELDDDRYERFYSFEARQNDIITIRMSRIGGRLDSFLVLTNAVLQSLAENDDIAENQNSEITEYIVPSNGTYYIIATRFEREDGETSGRFRLELQSLGNAFDSVAEGVPRIAYGTTATGNIDDETSAVMYAFWGVEGDTVTVSMNRGDGDLDPVVAILNSDRRRMIYDDDGGGGNNARINRYELRYTGIYYVRAERYSGSEGNSSTSGSFILVLARRFD